MEFEVKKPVEIPEGMHQGEIVAVEYRDKPFSYVDVIIKLTDVEEEPKIKIGFPACLTVKSKLGQFLSKFGAPIENGNKIDPEKVLVGKHAVFMTYNEQVKDGRYARIVPDSIRFKGKR